MKKIKSDLSVAIIDKDIVFREKLKSQIESFGEFNVNIVLEADSGANVLGMLKKAHADIIFTDIIETTDMDWSKFLQSLVDSNSSKCVIVISECTEFKYVKTSFLSGAFDYIKKPVKICDVQNALQRAKEMIDKETSAFDSSNYGEHELIECIKRHGLYMQPITEDFIHHYLDGEEADNTHFKMNIAIPLQHITQELCTEFAWLENIIPPFEYTKKMMYREENTDYVIIIIKDYLSMLCQKLDEYYPENKSEISKRVIDYILSRPYEKHMLSDVANIVFTSNAYLSHTFKMDIGISFVDYCSRYKIESAKILLLYSDLNIKEIADRLQYEDYKYMGRLFKHIVGTTPTKYRNGCAH